MLITKTSQISGKTNTMFINTTSEAISEFNNRSFGSGRLIQDIFPNLTPGEREFIKSGITPEEWIEQFGDPFGTNQLMIDLMGNPLHDQFGSQELIF
jgi:hypothetical protein